MKNTFLLSAFLTLFLAFPFDARPAISIEKLKINAAQVGPDAVESALTFKAKHKGIRKLFKEKIRAIVENATPFSNGGIALVLILSSMLVFLVMPVFAMLSFGFYLTGVFFSILGLGKDENKAAAIIALALAILPILVLAGMFITCIIKGCFD